MNNDENHHQITNLIPGIIFTILFIGAITLASQYNKDSSSWISYTVSTFGTFLSGVGTIGLFFLAIFQLPLEFKKFRLQQEHIANQERDRLDNQAKIERRIRMDEKIENVALETMEATYRLVNAIQHISNPFSYSGEGNTSELEEKKKATNDDSEKAKLNAEIFLKMFNSRLDTCKDDINLFFKLKIKAKIFLDNRFNNLIGEIEKQFITLRVSARIYSSGLNQGAETMRIPTYKEAYEEFYDLKDVRQKILKEKMEELEKLMSEYFQH
jgi:hypothetical protein